MTMQQAKAELRPGVRAEQSREHRMSYRTQRGVWYVEVPDPEDPEWTGVPLYTGPAADVGLYLMPGSYEANVARGRHGDTYRTEWTVITIGWDKSVTFHAFTAHGEFTLKPESEDAA